MSYCVNCGVELADTEQRCPLCRVEVVNPVQPWEEPEQRPYSRHVDTLMKRIDRRYFATLAGLLLLIPCAVAVLVNLITGDEGITWSAYVIGAVALAFLFVLLPFFFKKYHAFLFLSINCAGVLLYLLFIERVNGGDWFLGLGMPITVAGSLCVLPLSLLFSRKRPSFLVRLGSILVAAGFFVVCVDAIIGLYVWERLRLAWSPYAFIPCLVLGAAALLLEHRQNLKDRVRRRLFY